MPWVSRTPLGEPVEPEVKAMAAGASSAIGSIRPGFGDSAAATMRDQSDDSTSRRSRRLRKASIGSRLSQQAFRMPSSASGRVRAIAVSAARQPMPGSMATGTAPTLSRPWKPTSNCSPGRSASSTRVPLPIPEARSTRATASVRRSSSPKPREAWATSPEGPRESGVLTATAPGRSWAWRRRRWARLASSLVKRLLARRGGGPSQQKPPPRAGVSGSDWVRLSSRSG